MREPLISIVHCFEKFVLYRIKRIFPEIENYFIAGSVGEGLFGFPGLFTKIQKKMIEKQCDVDIMGTVHGIVVMERRDVHYTNVEVLKLENIESLPGYAFLRKLDNDYCTIDYFSSQEIRNIYKDCAHSIDYGGALYKLGRILNANKCSQNGPALMIDLLSSNFHKSPFELTKSIDFVFSIHCDEWPSVADEWIERKRSGWPSGTLIAKAVEMGCDLVPIGPGGNSPDDKEWRISLVRAERLLIHALNSTQLKTLALLKIIFKNKDFGEIFRNKISSYVAKTAFFWTSEEYNGDQWEDSDCINYVKLCLLKLLHFVKHRFCPNYFVRECDVFREKLNEMEKQSCVRALDQFITGDCFKDKILDLGKFKGARTTCVQLLSLLKKFGNNVNVCIRNVIERITDKSIQESLGGYIFEFLSTPSEKNFKSSIEELWFLLGFSRDRPLISDIASNVHSIAFQDFFIRNLTCAQLRVLNTDLSRFELSVNERFDIFHTLLSQANLKTETLCAAEITQIAHVFFTKGLYENALHLIIPMLEEFKKVSLTRLNCINSYVILTSSPSNDVFFTSPWRPICDITFFNLEESILTEHLMIEMVLAGLGYKIHAESRQIKSAVCPYLVNVHPLVYAYYMKYKCCIYMGRNIDSIRALQELEDQVLENTEHGYFNLNLLGCSLYESGNFERAVKIFALAYRKRDNRISVFYHVGILLRRCLKDNYKTDIGTN